MAKTAQPKKLTHKGSTFETVTGGNSESLRIDGNNVPFETSNGKYYTDLLPYHGYDDLETMAKALIEVHPLYRKRAPSQK
jgi:hypothetical protein